MSSQLLVYDIIQKSKQTTPTVVQADFHILFLDCSIRVFDG